MHAALRFALLLPFAALLGCGANPTPSTPSVPASAYLNLTGDWIALAPGNPLSPGLLPTPVADFMGALQSSGSTVTGTLHAISLSFPQCVDFNQDLEATGTIDANNNLKLSIPLAGGTATITATIVTPESYTNATWQIVGGACAMPSTAIDIAEFAPATGTYTGVLNALDLTTGLPVAGTATNVTAVLTQSTTPNSDGQFPLSGTVTTTGACTSTSTLNKQVVEGGLFMQLSTTMYAPLLSGGISPQGTMLIADLIPGAPCGSNVYSGTLTRQ